LLLLFQLMVLMLMLAVVELLLLLRCRGTTPHPGGMPVVASLPTTDEKKKSLRQLPEWEGYLCCHCRTEKRKTRCCFPTVSDADAHPRQRLPMLMMLMTKMLMALAPTPTLPDAPTRT